jgi:pSer/pThr/pTyr-binding forkhead associated (FHA) protein
MALQKFERRLERFVEGAFARVFRSGLQPVEIGRRLTREIDLRRTVAPRGVLAPNAFRVLLSSADRVKFEPIEDELNRELVEVARDHAKHEGYTFLGPVSVTIETDASLRPGTLLVAGDMVPEQGTATLTLPDGRRIVLDQDKVTLGRLPECELALADAGVSRRHAEVRRGADNGWRVTDLASTNGTKVNGLKIKAPRELQDGDEITIGTTSIRFATGAASTSTPVIVPSGPTGAPSGPTGAPSGPTSSRSTVGSAGSSEDHSGEP